MRYYHGYGRTVARFAEGWIRQTKGRWAGEPLALEPWQSELLDELFLVDQDRNFVYREALVGVPRKNGKSTLCAAIALYALLASGEVGAEVYAAAASKDQARVVFDQAREFVEASPKLRDWLTPMRNAIVCKATGGVFRVLSSDAPKQYGLNPSCVVIDELHAHENPELYYALTTGQLARENPLVVSITTAGFDRESICWQVYEHGRRLEYEGGIDKMRRSRFLFRWYEAPAGTPADDREAWRTANPSSWIDLDDLALEYDRLPEFVFRRLHLNQWTAIEDAWVSEEDWDACAGTPIINEDDDAYGGLDVGITRDSSAIVVAQWHGDDLHVKQKLLLPEKHPNLGIADVKEEVAANSRQVKMRQFGFDPWMFRESAEELTERGIPMVQIDQNASRMGPASEAVYELIREKRLVHDGSLDMRTQILAAVAAPTERGWRISKRKSKARIDGAVALAIAADRAVEGRMTPVPSRRVAFL